MNATDLAIIALRDEITAGLRRVREAAHLVSSASLLAQIEAAAVDHITRALLAAFLRHGSAVRETIQPEIEHARAEIRRLCARNQATAAIQQHAA